MFDFSLYQKTFTWCGKRNLFVAWPHRLIVLLNGKPLKAHFVQCTWKVQIFMLGLTGYAWPKFIDYGQIRINWNVLLELKTLLQLFNCTQFLLKNVHWCLLNWFHPWIDAKPGIAAEMLWESDLVVMQDLNTEVSTSPEKNLGTIVEKI